MCTWDIFLNIYYINIKDWLLTHTSTHLRTYRTFHLSYNSCIMKFIILMKDIKLFFDCQSLSKHLLQIIIISSRSNIKNNNIRHFNDTTTTTTLTNDKIWKGKAKRIKFMNSGIIVCLKNIFSVYVMNVCINITI